MRVTIGLLFAALIGLSPSLRASGTELRNIERSVTLSTQQQHVIERRLQQMGMQQHELRQRAQQLTGQRGSLARSELSRLQTQLRRLQVQLNQQQRALQIARQQLQAQQRRLLQAYQGLGKANALQVRRIDNLRRELGLGDNKADSIRSQLERYDRSEKQLRRKARELAQRIRQLRREQAVAGGVADSLRDQSLFDEQERRLELSRAITRRSVKTGGQQSAADQGGDDSARSQEPSAELGGTECSGGACGSSGSGGNAPPVDPGYDNGGDGFSGTQDPSGGGNVGNDADLGAGPVLQARGQSTELSELISGERVTDLVESDLSALFGDAEHLGSSAAEMRELNHLRRELLRQADQLAQQRRTVETRARQRKVAN